MTNTYTPNRTGGTPSPPRGGTGTVPSGGSRLDGLREALDVLIRHPGSRPTFYDAKLAISERIEAEGRGANP